MTRSAGARASLRVRPAVAGVTALLLALAWYVLGAPPASADGPTTFSNTASIAIPKTGSANQKGPADPYPSSIDVSGMTGSVTKVTVTYHDLTHSILNDIDSMVVAPTGENLEVMSDASGDNTFTFATNATLTFDDAAAATIPSSGNVPSGTYRPINNSPGGEVDSFPPPAPTPSTNTTLAQAFTGIDPNGTWKLWAVDDTSGDVGTMAGGWSLSITTETAAVATTTTVTSSDASSTTGDPVTFTATVKAGATPVTAGAVQFSADGSNLGNPVSLNGSGVATFTTSSLAEGTHLIRATYSGATGFLTSNGTMSQRVDNATVVSDNTFCNPGKITIPDKGTSTPYPSNVFVSGLSGQVTKVTATIKGLSHTSTIDVDALLSAPTTSKNLFLLSDAGGDNNGASNVNLTFDDAAAGPVPSPIVSGTYRPTNINSVDQPTDPMPAPAPTPTSATTMASLNGGSPNGTWSLWVVDDATGDSGQIANGWCVTITSQSPTTTSVTAAPNPSTFGQAVTLKATVASGGSPVVAGSVQFSDGGTDLGAPVPVGADGTATLTTSDLSVGSHPITATYGGTADLATSSGSVTQVVNKAETTTELTSSKNPSQVGDAVTFTATVTSGGGPQTSGSVTFAVDGTDQPAVPVDADGTATFTTATLAAGTHTIRAAYGGTASFATSSAQLDQVVNRFDTTTALTTSGSPSVFGDDVTFTATVTSAGSPVLAGGVEFLDGSASLGVVSLSADGTATFTIDNLAVGSHTIHANYAETTAYGASADQLIQVVGQQASATTVSAAPNPSSFGTSVTFTATVAVGATPVTGGTVQFSEGGTNLGAPVPLAADGSATFSTATLAGGSHTITATYSGTADVAGSSGSVDQVVNSAASTTVLTSTPDPSVFGQSVTLTATVTSAGGQVTTGTVTFTEAATVLCAAAPVQPDGTATCAVDDLGAGAHQLTATFSGSADFAGSSGQTTQTVDQATTQTALTGPTTGSLGADLEYTATVTGPNGPLNQGAVVFTVDGTVVGGPVDVDATGKATFTTKLAAGSHTIDAEYTGTPDYADSPATQITVVVSVVADAGGPYDIAEGGGVTLDGTGSSSGADSYEWDLNGDGVFGDVSGPSPVLTWKELESFGIDDGQATPTTYPIALRVTSGTAAPVTATSSLVVSNTAPISVITGSLTATVGKPFTVKVGAQDPSSADMAAQFGYTIDWGDGSPVETLTGPADPPVSHTYTSRGSFAAAFIATDKDGGQGEKTAVVVLAEPAASPSPSPSPSGSSSATAPSGPTSSGGAGNLANTGASIGPGWIVAGPALLIGGAGLLLLASRRRARHGFHT